MTEDALLLARLRAHEDNFVERKPASVKAAEIRQSIVAFANSVPSGATGALFIGIHDDGNIQGVDNTDKLQKTVRDQCENVCYPPISYSCQVLHVDNKAVLAVIVQESERKPHFSGPAYVRRGSESPVASHEEYERLIASRNSKAGAILAMRTKIVTVICIKHKLGSTQYIAGADYRTRSECRVLDCTAHAVRLQDIASSSHISEPLELVSISHDEEKWRPMLIVRGP